MSSFEIKGVDKLLKKLEYMEKLGDLKSNMGKSGEGLKTTMKSEAKFKGHYDSSGNFIKPTGKTRDSIKSEKSLDGLTFKVYPTTEYAKYLEYGTRKMSAQPFIRKSVEKHKKQFQKDMEDSFKGGE